MTGWLRLAVGVMIIGGVFISAIMVTHLPPLFEVHTLVLDRNIDTGALYYTDIEEFAMAEERLAILFSWSD
jgi:hypothetical protein